jgi:hypothetical protein
VLACARENFLRNARRIFAAAHPSEAMRASQVQEFNKGEFHMTKFISITIAFTLFAPVAIALAAQAAQIVA